MIAEKKPTQYERILQALQEAGEAGVTNIDMNNKMHIFRYGARLKDLRDNGYTITSKHIKGSEWRFILKIEPKQLSLI